MPKLVTIYGGSGFVGRYITARMAKKGWRVRVAVRRPNEALFVKTYGNVGQVEPVLCNIRDRASIANAMENADAVVNCVGILAQSGKNSFEAVQYTGAKLIAQSAAAQGIDKMVHVSAIGADENAQSQYARTKALGEQAILDAVPNAMILRPSIIFGAEDQFFNRFAALTRFLPFVPIFGGDTLFQPVYVDDVAEAAVMGITGEAAGGIYELGGPKQASFCALMAQMLEVIERRRLVLSFPLALGRAAGSIFDLGEKLSFGLLKGPITYDQALNLANDNVVSATAHCFADLGITPKEMSAVLPEYLWRFRPSGQYASIKASARNIGANG